MIERYLEMKDGHRLFLRTWPAEGKAVATLHINHGMAEHSLRYDGFARYMNSLGFTVYAQDHRGHGLTKEEEERGWFSAENGWDVVVQDSIAVDQLIAGEVGYLPHFILGHSMGSFITRTALTRAGDLYSGAVIMGTGAGQGLLGAIGKSIARRHVRKYGGRMPDHRLDKLSFGAYNKHFKPIKTSADWLTRDPEEVRKYLDDPLCGFVCSSQFFYDLLTGIEAANDPDLAKKVPPVLPMLIVSGSEDPVGGYGKGVRKVADLYRKAGVRVVDLKLFEGGRHEILNETNKDEVYAYVGSWLSHLASGYGENGSVVDRMPPEDEFSRIARNANNE